MKGPFLLLLALFCLPGASHADTWHVATNIDLVADGTLAHPFSQIQQAMDAAAPGDRVLVQPGTYKGEGNKNLDFAGKAITVESTGGPSSTILDCEGVGRGLYFHSGETTGSVFSGFTISGANTQVVSYISGLNFESWEYGDKGSAILVLSNSSPVIENCHIKDSSSMTFKYIESFPLPNGGWYEAASADGYGGGVHCDASSLIFRNCVISNNQSGYHGGGVYAVNGSILTLENCEISGNTASLDGIRSMEYVPLYNGGFRRTDTVGRPYCGGGIFASNTVLTVQNSQIARNSGGSKGGGLYADHLPSLIVEYSHITDNTAHSTTNGAGGGGLFISHVATSVVHHCVLTGNGSLGLIIWTEQIDILPNYGSIVDTSIEADGAGGGLYATETDLSLLHSDFKNNYAGSFGGGLCVATNTLLRMSNCVLYANSTARNTPPGQGGGMAAYQSSVHMAEVSFSNNSASIHHTTGTELTPLLNGGLWSLVKDSNFGLGGALYADSSTIELFDGVFQQNRAGHGGSHYMVSSTSHFERVIFNESTAIAETRLETIVEIVPLLGGHVEKCAITHSNANQGLGGVMYLDNTHVALMDCQFSSNQAGAAGAVFYLSTNASVTATNCAFWGNISRRNFWEQAMYFDDDIVSYTNQVSSSGLGAVVYADAAAFSAMNCTFTGNQVGEPSNEFYAVAGSRLDLRNSILWTEEIVLEEGSTATAAYCCIAGGFPGEGHLDQNPRLTHHWRLRHDSPCIDRASAIGAPLRDLDGEERWDDPAHPSASIVDIGADEFVDTDTDTIADAWELLLFTDLLTIGLGTDFDEDLLGDTLEYDLGANPRHTDSDGDKIPDGWEYRFGLNLLNPGDAQWDSDEDTYSNGSEYIADTNPQDPDSVFQVANAFNQAGAPCLSWSGTVSRVYRLEASTNFSQWTSLGTLPGTGGFITHTLSPEDLSAEFIRIQVSMDE